MATAVIMPRQGQSVESCIITKWHKKVGDTVAAGDLLFTYETDKATFDEESKEAGTVLALLRAEGDDVPVLENVLILGNPGEDFSSFGQSAAAPAPQEEVKKEAPVAQAAAAPALGEQVLQSAGEQKVSPRAEGLANRTGADLSQATGTGPNGRVIERDVNALLEKGAVITPAARGLEGAPAGTGLGGRATVADFATPQTAVAAATLAEPQAAAAYTDVKLSNIRKVISKSMTASLTGMAQLTLTASFDATEILAYRAGVKASGEKLGLANITLNDMVLYAVSRTLLTHKDLNAHMLPDSMRYFADVNLGMAVDTERGLMVPTIFAANRLSLNELALAAKDLASQAQKGSISPDKLSGGTFTVSNLGTFGIESFTPVINPPQTGILGVNTLSTRVKEVKGQLVGYQCMGLSLTFDHRALDGAPAARFLKELCQNLENFSALLAK